jgi:hypothetical protein
MSIGIDSNHIILVVFHMVYISTQLDAIINGTNIIHTIANTLRGANPRKRDAA